MTITDLNDAVPAIKTLSELGLGVLGTLTTIGISIYFVASLAPLLKQLTKAVESVEKTNQSVLITLQNLNTVVGVHEQRSIAIEAMASSNSKKLNDLAAMVMSKEDARPITEALSDINVGVAKLCGKNGV